MEADELSQARIAENQSTFRAANEKIEAAAEDIGLDDEVPFICECPVETCTEIVRLTLAAYTEIRRHPRRFFNAPGHEATSVRSGAGVVVEECESYVVVEKVGVAGELAAEEYERGVTPGG